MVGPHRLIIGRPILNLMQVRSYARVLSFSIWGHPPGNNHSDMDTLELSSEYKWVNSLIVIYNNI